jgi:putative transposase
VFYRYFVPSHLKRYYGAGDLHFITCSCYHRQPVLGSPERRDLFLTVLEHVRQKYSFVILGYVVMPEHFHLLISEPQEQTPSVVMQALKLGFARRVQSTILKSVTPLLAPRTREKWGTRKVAPSNVWQRRFYDFNVRTEAKRIENCVTSIGTP